MKDSSVSPALLFAPSRQKRLVEGLVQRVASSRQEHERLLLAQNAQHVDLEQQLSSQLAEVKQNCQQDRRSTLQQWDQAQEKAIESYEAATIQTRDELRRVNTKYRRLLAEQESVINNKVAKRIIAINNQYKARKPQPGKQRKEEHWKLDQAIAGSNEDLEWARALTIRRLDRLLEIEYPTDIYAEFQETSPESVADAIELITRQNRRLKQSVAEMQTGFASKVVDSFYLPAGVAVFILIWAIVVLVTKAEPLIFWLIMSVPAAGAVGFLVYGLLLWPLRKMTRQLHPLTERNRKASESAVAEAKKISTQIAKDAAKELVERREEHLSEAKRWQGEQLKIVREKVEAQKVSEQEKLVGHLQQVDGQFRSGFATLQKTMRERANEIAQNINQALTQSDTAAGETRQRVQQQHQHTLESLAARLEIGLRRGTNRILAASDMVQFRFPPWQEILSNPPPPHESLDFLPLGQLRLGTRLKRRLDNALGYQHQGSAPDEADVLSKVSVPDVMPLVIHRRHHSGVIIETPHEHLDEAVAMSHQLLWRLLSSAVPGRVKVTLIDPASRGQHFASFMALADHDPSLIHHRIWTTGDKIAQRLAELTHHIEDVLQSSLRDRFERIEDYNEVAGSLAEPYHAIAAVGFPEGLSREAYSHLQSLIQSGLRCGVFVILVVEKGKAWPSDMPMFESDKLLRLTYRKAGEGDEVSEDTNHFGFEPRTSVATTSVGSAATQDSQVMSSGGSSVLTAGSALASLSDDSLVAHGHWRCVNEGLDGFEFWPYPPPSPAVRDPLTRRIGRATVEAARVIVPLESLLPDEQIPAPDSTASTDSGIAITIGSQGAGRTRALALGEGVRQHVLIAGKTGSGKSTLLHSIITAGAAMYRPDELNFYLLDFKKGVEFKVYADAKLPHARIIGIESEREFGRSVLQRLDAELTDRGEQFREAGVQEVGEFRKRRPDTLMPRIMLIVDEFQELFTRDDTLAADCTALLDRLVRQGRSFGLHIILSSQSLAGSNSLPRATLGQMAVRIAMQCSEADAALILADDNTAARLLARPGEAIYNDASGLLEGNHPFQVAWLEPDDHGRLLGTIGKRDEEFYERFGPPVVFEGNRPGRFTATLARKAIESAGTADTLIGLLGEAVELGPPSALHFQANTGRNAMLVAAPKLRPGVVGSIVATSLAYRPDLSITLLDGSRADDGESIGDWLSAMEVDAKIVRTRDAEAEMVALGKLVAARTVADGGTPQPLTERALDEFSLDAPGGIVGSTSPATDPTSEPADDGKPILVIIDALDRLRDLRQSDTLDFSLDATTRVDGSKALQNVLRDGPAVNVFVLITLPSAETLTRWLPRQSQHDLEMRLVGPLNAADSSLLIDSPIASELSPATMILYDDADGRSSKFRLCDPPAVEEFQLLLAKQ